MTLPFFLLALLPQVLQLAKAEPLSSKASNCTITYYVRAGDTLADIATKYSTTLPSLLSANPDIKDPSAISVDQAIIVPEQDCASSSPRPSSCTIKYTIKGGDTFADLAEKYDTPVTAILAANPGVEPRNLMVGQEVIIPKRDCPPSSFPSPPQNSCTINHTVAPDETFSLIAEKYGLNAEDLRRANPSRPNPDPLPVGDIISIPKQPCPPPSGPRTTACPSKPSSGAVAAAAKVLDGSLPSTNGTGSQQDCPPSSSPGLALPSSPSNSSSPKVPSPSAPTPVLQGTPSLQISDAYSSYGHWAAPWAALFAATTVFVLNSIRS